MMRKKAFKIVLLGSFLIVLLGALYVTSIPRELLALTNAPEHRLPQEAADFLEENFPGVRIVDIDLETFGYEVYLENGVIIDFTFRGRVDWIDYSYTPNTFQRFDVDDDDSQIIAVSSLPQRILEHISTFYPDDEILLAERDDDGYDVYISSGFRIEFDDDGSITVVSARP